ncbi:carboxyl-terminal processing protease CtpB [Synechocystis salina]|uniref:S41 family peptidase n=2 Tax=Synechocystis TaxID=1142 RepID=A0ABR9VPC1_9SYNC|nr:carboxyl-terminal processing protease CtpB [Synechocystis salina]MBD2654122.1 S41 family peptidase [Synechocystis sp. FACHB-383]MBE9241530.1 S41 family peptidase [Synechocystis salina LEGE 00041]MBE9253214.1 S41 family peptidase [Synechocystis salina LEGE 00031]
MSPHLLRLRPLAAALVFAFGLGANLKPALSAPNVINPDSPPLATPKENDTGVSDNVTLLENSPKAVVDEVWQLVNQQFVDKDFNHSNWLSKRQELLGRNYQDNAEAYRQIGRILKDLNDPYTRFLSPEEFAILSSQTAGEASGVGIRVLMDKRSSDLVVVDVMRGTPALKAGIRPGDRIVRINGQPAALMSLEQATEAIQGEIGSELSLQLSRPKSGVFSVTLKRENIEIDSVTYNVKEEGELRVGYIRLDEFSSHSAEQMEKAITELNNSRISGYILDLRGNPGGLLLSSIDIARLWLNRGEIVSTIDRRGGDRHFSANGRSLTDLPLVVLVNERSASASEILAGALKEQGRATVVGTATYGKGTVQSVNTLSDGSGLAVTIARYYPPSGTDINHKGISPDIHLDISNDTKLQFRNDPDLIATDVDPQYQRAISVLRQHRHSLGLPPTKDLGIGLLEPSQL